MQTPGVDPIRFVRVYDCGCEWGYKTNKMCDLAEEASEKNTEFLIQHRLNQYEEDSEELHTELVREQGVELITLTYANEQHYLSQYEAREYEDVPYETYYGEEFDWEEHFKSIDEASNFYAAMSEDALDPPE